MAKDPYRVLGVPHSANAAEIKQSYRTLARQYHPDRVLDPAEKDKATSSFAEIATAYALLSDPKRKAQFDHIYKYGGFDGADHDNDNNKNERWSAKSQQSNNNLSSSQRNGLAPNFTADTTQQRGTSSSASYRNPDTSSFHASRKRKSGTGIGYICSDPLAFLWSQGKVQIRQTVAGIQVPSRLQSDGGGIRFAFSAGYISKSQAGIKQYSSTTTQFSQGKKFTRTETTTIYPDGTKEVVIEGNDCGEQRYYSTTTTTCTTVPNGNCGKSAATTSSDEGVTQHDETLPWYMSAWSEIKDKLAMCYNPCVVTKQ